MSAAGSLHTFRFIFKDFDVKRIDIQIALGGKKLSRTPIQPLSVSNIIGYSLTVAKWEDGANIILKFLVKFQLQW